MLSLILIVIGVAIVCYALWTGAHFQHSDRTQGSNTSECSSEKREDPVFFGPIDIFYASQTGTAGKFAKSLVSEGKLNDVVCVAKNIQDCSVEELKQSKNLTIFLVSTHYEGEPTDDMVPFWREFSKLKGTDFLRNLKYTGFSLGDLNYKYYCRMGRLVNQKLKELGADHVYEFGEGSNHNGHIDEFFEEWYIPLWNNLIPHLGKLSQDQAQEIWESSDPNSYIIRETESKGPFQLNIDGDFQLETSVELYLPELLKSI